MMILSTQSAARRKSGTLHVLSFCLAILLHSDAYQLSPNRFQIRSRCVASSHRPNAPLSSLRMSSPGTMPVPRIAVSIDQPLISDTLFPAVASKPTKLPLVKPAIWFKSLSTALTGSPVVKIALITFCAALILSLALKQVAPLLSKLKTTFKIVNGRMERLLEKVQKVEEGVPMPFEDKDREGWGVCTLRSKRRLGKTSFMEYNFDLPQQDYTLPLDLGQTISMCCLDNEDNVVKGDFFPFYPNVKAGIGSFSILAPSSTKFDELEFAVGYETAKFCRAIQRDMKVGDEIALKPGPNRLAYRGQYLPVTDMVYVASGVGIVPVLDQVRSVLPNGSSSVKSVTVLWINSSTKDFDVTSEILEKEYFKYSSKLAVSCVVDDLRIHSMADNNEINAAIPNFRQGTMAVVAGPSAVTSKTVAYLEDRGYPKDTICIL